ncbi:shikimate kinase [Metabacillus lacus]|nr:shikimate kinase [Metabacillus lacus]
MKVIYLTGFMGAGKTTVGMLLGEKLDLPVYDTDQQVERAENASVKDIFSSRGEAYFRRLEERVLRELPTENAVVMTGGGIIENPDNRNFMRNNGTVVFLNTNIDIILYRLENDTSRPLVQGRKREEIKKLYTKRKPLYEDCSLSINASNKNPEEIVKELEAVLNASQLGKTE